MSTLGTGRERLGLGEKGEKIASNSKHQTSNQVQTNENKQKTVAKLLLNELYFQKSLKQNFVSRSFWCLCSLLVSCFGIRWL